MSNSSLRQDKGVRELRADELNVVTGGITGGCIRLPILPILRPQDPKPQVDWFGTPILPSWVAR